MKTTDAQALLNHVRLLDAQAQALGRDLETRAAGAVEGGTSPPDGQGSFGDLMRTSLDRVNDSMRSAEAQTNAFLRQDPGASLVETMVAVNKAQVSFRTLVEVRNQLIQAYKDIANMPV